MTGSDRTAFENDLCDALKDGRPRTVEGLQTSLGTFTDAGRIVHAVARARDLHQMADGRVVLMPRFVDGMDIVVVASTDGVVPRSDLTLLARRFKGWASVPLTIQGGGRPALSRAGGWRLQLPPGPQTGTDPATAWVARSGPEGISVVWRPIEPVAQQIIERIARRTPDPSPDTRSPLNFQLAVVAQNPRLPRRTPVRLGALRRISARHRRASPGTADGDTVAA